MNKTLKIVLLLTLLNILWITISKTYCKYVLEDCKKIGIISIQNILDNEEITILENNIYENKSAF